MSGVMELKAQEHKSIAAEIVGFDADIRQPRISYSTIAVEEVRRLATRYYKFPNPMRCVLYHRGINDVYKITLPERQFALRISRANWRTRSALLSELTVINHLHEKGIEVAFPIPRADSDWITEIMAPEGLRYVMVYSWVDGSKIKYDSESNVQQLGRLIARVHNALGDMAPQPALPNMDVNFLLRMSLDVIRPAVAERPSILLELTELARRLELRLTLISGTLRDWGLCHGDVANHNAHVDGDRCVLFDFDFCGWGWRLFDLATYRLQARCEGFEKQAWSPFIREYLALRPDVEASLEHVGLFMCLRYLWIAGKSVERLDEEGIGALPDTYFETLIRVCKGIEADCRDYSP